MADLFTLYAFRALIFIEEGKSCEQDWNVVIPK
jgi:hypothetical protein